MTNKNKTEYIDGVMEEYNKVLIELTDVCGYSGTNDEVEAFYKAGDIFLQKLTEAMEWQSEVMEIARCPHEKPPMCADCVEEAKQEERKRILDAVGEMETEDTVCVCGHKWNYHDVHPDFALFKYVEYRDECDYCYCKKFRADDGHVALTDIKKIINDHE